jgi:transposase-like protein
LLATNHPDNGFHQEDVVAKEKAVTDETSLEWFACPNPECAMFNRFAAGNLSVAERMGKDKAIRRLYCNHCHQRFSERQGSLMQYTKLTQETVVRVIKCLTHGCSVEATADICEVHVRSVRRLLERAGPRAEDFHRLQLQKLEHPPEIVELDELHGKVSRPPRDKKGGAQPATLSLLGGVVQRVATGFMWPWR